MEVSFRLIFLYAEGQRCEPLHCRMRRQLCLLQCAERPGLKTSCNRAVRYFIYLRIVFYILSDVFFYVVFYPYTVFLVTKNCTVLWIRRDLFRSRIILFRIWFRISNKLLCRTVNFNMNCLQVRSLRKYICYQRRILTL
jgi:hypothetical protein